LFADVRSHAEKEFQDVRFPARCQDSFRLKKKAERLFLKHCFKAHCKQKNIK